MYIFVGGYKSVAGNIGQLAKKINNNVQIIYTPWMKTPTLLETAGDSIENSVIPSQFPPIGESPSIQDYVRRFRRKYAHFPTSISLNVFSILQVIEEAISAGKRSPEEMKKYILHKGSFTTQFGTVSFDQNGDVVSQLYFIKNIKQEFDQ